MMDKYTYRWTIDDVLDPNSAFWKKMYSDIKEKPETGLESIERDMWKDSVKDFPILYDFLLNNIYHEDNYLQKT